MSKIEWTERTWNPVVGCSRVSAGCDHCYAVRQSHRLEGMGQAKYAGLTVLNPKGDRHFNGVVRCVEDALSIPLKRKKPTTWFVNSMGDLFHERVPFEFIDKVFAVMALCPQHTFQVLTKRPERMAEYLHAHRRHESIHQWAAAFMEHGSKFAWPLPGVWLGTSCEDQAAADERVPHLLRCPAAVRFLSCEPLLGALDLHYAIWCLPVRRSPRNALHQVIVGGESGPGARPCNVASIRSIVQQCKAGGVPCFVKQLGKRAYEVDHDARVARGSVAIDVHAIAFGGWEYEPKWPRDPKGNKMAEWPEDLRVREYPVEEKLNA